MKSTASLDPALLTETAPAEPAPAGNRARAYVSLTKPRLVLMVLITVGVGYAVGAHRPISLVVLSATLIGTALVAGGSGALNQWMEHARDARMRRTAGRAIPSGRVAPVEAALVGVLLVVSGVGVLLVWSNWLAAAVAAATFILYFALYTPLKPITTLNTIVGAVPGALPPVIGWAAATGRLGVEAWVLFLIVFLWQFPHFLAIAWIYREDYRRAGFQMVTADDILGRQTGRYAVTYALALLPAGLLPTTIGLAGPIYFVGAFALGLFYFLAAVAFWRDVNDARARRLLRASFLYLPAILILLLVNPAT